MILIRFIIVFKIFKIVFKLLEKHLRLKNITKI